MNSGYTYYNTKNHTTYIIYKSNIIYYKIM